MLMQIFSKDCGHCRSFAPKLLEAIEDEELGLSAANLLGLEVSGGDRGLMNFLTSQFQSRTCPRTGES